MVVLLTQFILCFGPQQQCSNKVVVYLSILELCGSAEFKYCTYHNYSTHSDKCVTANSYITCFNLGIAQQGYALPLQTM